MVDEGSNAVGLLTLIKVVFPNYRHRMVRTTQPHLAEQAPPLPKTKRASSSAAAISHSTKDDLLSDQNIMAVALLSHLMGHLKLLIQHRLLSLFRPNCQHHRTLQLQRQGMPQRALWATPFAFGKR